MYLISDILTKRIEGSDGRSVKTKMKQELHYKKPDTGPVVLTMDHVSVGFQIWLLALFFSSVAFVCEIVPFWAPRIFRMILIRNILRKFYEHLVINH